MTIAPLRYGAGLKGKVLESFAAGIPCVMTTIAAEGLDLPSALEPLVVDGPAEIAARVAKLCRDDSEYRRIVEAGKVRHSGLRTIGPARVRVGEIALP